MKLFRNIFNSFDIKTCKRNYQRKLEELRNRNKENPIRVLFLVRENQKWSYQSLYEEMAKSDEFEPLVVVSLLWLSHIGKDKTRNNLEENYRFFKDRGMNVDFAYKNGNYINLKEFNPDIVFYDQPWDLPKLHKPLKVSEYALTAYVPYGNSMLSSEDDYQQYFHKLLYKYYIDGELNLKRYESYKRFNSTNCVLVGSPKLDVYFHSCKESSDNWKDDAKFKVIYAPHHSFEQDGLMFATFKENGKFILELAKKYQDKTTWIFKPHPRFKYALLRQKIMTQCEIDEYYKAWEMLGNVYEQGDYFDIFRTSDLMITDCCSFIAEYLPADKPMIRLINNQCIPFNAQGEILKQACYEAYNNFDLENVFKDLMINKNDYKKEKRKELISLVIDYQNKSSSKVYKNLVSELMEGV